MHRNARQVTRVINIKAFWSFLPHTRNTRSTRHELRRAREAVVFHGRRTQRFSRSEAYWELSKRPLHKDILGRQPQSCDSEIELPRAVRGTLLDIVHGSRYSISRQP